MEIPESCCKEQATCLQSSENLGGKYYIIGCESKLEDFIKELRRILVIGLAGLAIVKVLRNI